MSENRQESQGAGITPADVYFILFRQKWVILIFSLLGILGACLLLFVVKPPQYQSQALISIRYVVEGKSLNPPGDQSNTRPLDERSSSIINTEIAVLHSWDLAKQVAQAMTPEMILAKVGGGSDVNRAAAIVMNGITVDSVSESSVISITYQNADVSLVQPVLNEFIDAYLAKHVQTHEGLGVPNSFLTNETARLSAELAQTSDALRKIKNAAGVISVEGTEKAYADQISKIREDLFNSEAELSEHQAMLSEQTQSSGAQSGPTNFAPVVQAPSDQVEKYKSVCALLAYLQTKEQNYLTQQGFTLSNVLVVQVQEQIVQNQTFKKDLEAKYPGLLALNIPLTSPVASSSGAPVDFRTESEQVSALNAKIRVLNMQLNRLWAEATNFETVKTTILELEQKRQIEETNLKYYQSNLEENRVDQALGADKAANIKIIQGPSPPSKGWSKSFKKKVAMVGVGGLLAGLALAFFIELFWDRSVKRPADVEIKLRLPLFASIPDITRNGHRRLTTNPTPLLLKEAVENKRQPLEKSVSPLEAEVDSTSRRHPLRRFYEGLRDRLVVYFEVRNLTHNPKLIGVTSCARGAGVSSIATGLAASLSETGEGNVLLVDMTVEGGVAQHFHKGKPNCGLDSALKAETRQDALVQENLYVATEPIRSEQLPQVLPKRFAGLISKIRSSDYDYIIFDMPPVAETTMTFRAAGHMDMVLLVLEAEKNNQEVVKRVISLLAESKANVSTVLNKTRTYIPPGLHQEFLHDV